MKNQRMTSPFRKKKSITPRNNRKLFERMNSYILPGQLDIIRVMEIYRAVSTFQRYKWTIFRLISHSF